MRVDLLSPDGNGFQVWGRFSDEDYDLCLERCADVEIAPELPWDRIHALNCEIYGVGFQDALFGFAWDRARGWEGIDRALRLGVAPMQPFLMAGRIDYNVWTDWETGVKEAEAQVQVSVLDKAPWTAAESLAAWERFFSACELDLTMAVPPTADAPCGECRWPL